MCMFYMLPNSADSKSYYLMRYRMPNVRHKQRGAGDTFGIWRHLCIFELLSQIP